MKPNEENTEVGAIQDAVIIPSQPASPMELDVTEDLLAKADQMVKSGLLPDSVQTAQAAVAIMQYGRELNFPPMASFANIFVVNGKPTLATKAMAGLLYKGGVRWTVLKDYELEYQEDGTTVKDRITTIQMIRDGITNNFSFRYTDAVTAGLTNRDVWKKYTKNMMYWRCFSMLADRVAPDLLLGIPDAAMMMDVSKHDYIINEAGELTISK